MCFIPVLDFVLFAGFEMNGRADNPVVGGIAAIVRVLDAFGETCAIEAA